MVVGQRHTPAVLPRERDFIWYQTLMHKKNIKKRISIYMEA
jgi:hypothetical protein